MRWVAIGLVGVAVGCGGGGSGSGPADALARPDLEPNFGDFEAGVEGDAFRPPDAGTPIEAPLPIESRCPLEAERLPGDGHLGCWYDEDGAPAYEYGPADGVGPYFTRRDGEGGADDHWHQVGNLRLTASVHADGRVRLFDGTRGGKWVSAWSESRLAVDGAAVLPSASRRVRFGLSSAGVTTEAFGVVAERTVFAPPGDEPVLWVVHRLQNTGASEVEVAVTETWDATMEPLLVGLTFGSAPQVAENNRDSFMRRFEQTAAFDPAGSTVTVDTDLRGGEMPPAREAPAEGDFYPGAIALTLLDGPADGFAVRKATECPTPACEPETRATRGASTTRFGPPPYGLVTMVPGDEAPAATTGAPGEMVASLTKHVRVGPGRETRVRFAILYDDEARLPDALARVRTESPTFETSKAAWREAVPQVAFAEGDTTAQALARELAWHGSYLLGATTFDEMYGVHNIDQGSAYGYLQGLRGAARDSLINAVAVLPLNADLAREQIEYVLGTTALEADGARISYGTSGFGMLEAAIVHRDPSDLDLWLLWALVEYTLTTRDFDFLSKSVAYHPPGAGPSEAVLGRIRASLDRMEGHVGYGPHGLLRVGSGDWSDGISFLAADREAFAADGESMFNSAFAAYVYPRVAGLLDGRDDALAARFRNASEALRAALATQFQGRWFPRAWDGLGAPIAADDGTADARISLEHHVWLLIGDLMTPEQRTSVTAAIDERLRTPSPIGALLMHPPIDSMLLHPGWDVNGGVWAAMNGLLVWGLSRSDPQAAWDELVANSMLRHAETYPDLWYGIWSGPDAYNAAYADRPGETFYHIATPMTDYPVQNSNRHAAPLIDLVKLAGFEATPEGLTIDPRLPAAVRPFSVSTPLLGWDEREPGVVRGHATFRTPGAVRARLPFEAARVAATVNGVEVAAEVADGFARFNLPAGRATFEVRPLE